MYNYQKSSSKYETLQRIFEDSTQDAQQEMDENQENHLVDKLTSINPDYVGWIKIDDTKINYPVVQTTDNSLYLSRNFYKEKDFVGSIFLDYRNRKDVLDKHLVVYGHNMKDHSMFGSLNNYLGSNFYETHKNIRFDIHGYTYEWEIFSAYIVHNSVLLETEFQSEGEFEVYIESIAKKSLLSIPTDINKEDYILTLSTCTSGSDRERMIVHAKLLNLGE
jgi:sortase B